ncbi:hypothetical protein ACU4GD_41590 [Cupriavidus basilensis]
MALASSATRATTPASVRSARSMAGEYGVPQLSRRKSVEAVGVGEHHAGNHADAGLHSLVEHRLGRYRSRQLHPQVQAAVRVGGACAAGNSAAIACATRSALASQLLAQAPRR